MGQSEYLKSKAYQLRQTVLEMCIKAGTGHVTSCFSCVEIMVQLFYETMTEDDIFILSKGQASPLLYAILADKGKIKKEELWKFAQKDGTLGVHLDHHIEGSVITAGSLGHGLGIAAGLAKAKKLNNEPGTIYCLLGDGECYEGSVWEAAQFIGENDLDNVVVHVDANGLMVMCAPQVNLAGVFAAFGVPHFQIHKTVKGKGIPFMENRCEWHGLAPQGEEAERARRELSDRRNTG